MQSYKEKLLPAIQRQFDLIEAVKRFREEPDNRVTPEIKGLISKFTFTTANRAATLLKTDISRFYKDIERRFFWRAYYAIDRGDWNPAKCSYKTWVTQALIFESRSLCAKLGIEQIKWSLTESLDAPVALPSANDARNYEVIDILDTGLGRDFYRIIDLRDVRDQLVSKQHQRIFDAVLEGAQGWKQFAEVIRCSRHEWYDHIWPNFVAVVKSIIGEWRVQA